MGGGGQEPPPTAGEGRQPQKHLLGDPGRGRRRAQDPPVLCLSPVSTGPRAWQLPRRAGPRGGEPPLLTETRTAAFLAFTFEHLVPVGR